MIEICRLISSIESLWPYDARALPADTLPCEYDSHTLQQYAPWAAFKTLSFLLGRQDSLSSTAIDATLYPDDAELFGTLGREKRTNPFRHADDEL